MEIQSNREGFKMRHGARINRKFLMNRSKKCKKCVVCGKALRPENQSGLCSMDLSRESTLNWNHQIAKGQEEK